MQCPVLQANLHPHTFVIGGPDAKGEYAGVAGGIGESLRTYNAARWAEDTAILQTHFVPWGGTIEDVVDAVALIGLWGPGEAFGSHGGIVTRIGEAWMCEDVGMAGAVSIDEARSLECRGLRPRYNGTVMVVEIGGKERPVAVRWFVEVTTDDDGVAFLSVSLRLKEKRLHRLVAHGAVAVGDECVRVSYGSDGAESVAVVAAYLVVGVVEIVEVCRIDRHLVMANAGTEPVDTTMVIDAGENCEAVGYGVAREEARVVTVERPILFAALTEALGDAVAETRVVVVAHLAQRHEVGPQPHNLVDDGIVAAIDHRTFLPDVPLQYRDGVGGGAQ